MSFERFTATYPTETPQSTAAAAGGVGPDQRRGAAAAGVSLDECAASHGERRAGGDAVGEPSR